jgi:hypothetical protein
MRRKLRDLLRRRDGLVAMVLLSGAATTERCRSACSGRSSSETSVPTSCSAAPSARMNGAAYAQEPSLHRRGPPGGPVAEPGGEGGDAQRVAARTRWPSPAAVRPSTATTACGPSSRRRSPSGASRTWPSRSSAWPPPCSTCGRTGSPPATSSSRSSPPPPCRPSSRPWRSTGCATSTVPSSTTCPISRAVELGARTIYVLQCGTIDRPRGPTPSAPSMLRSRPTGWPGTTASSATSPRCPTVMDGDRAAHRAEGLPCASTTSAAARS